MQPPPWVERFIGIPYAKGQSSFEGADCWGVLNLAWREHFGIALPPYEGPLWTPGPQSTAREAIVATRAIGEAAAAYSARFTPVARGQEREGDGALLRNGSAASHCALVVAPGLMLHTEVECDSVCEAYEGIRWGRRVVGFYRHG